MGSIASTSKSLTTGISKSTVKSDFWKNAEYNRWGIVTYIILVVACLGGVTAGFGSGGNIVELALTVVPTMMTLAFVLAVAPMRLIVWTAAVAVLMDLVLFVI